MKSKNDMLPILQLFKSRKDARYYLQSGSFSINFFLPGYEQPVSSTKEDDTSSPPLMPSMYNAQYSSISQERLEQIGNEKLSQEEADFLEIATRSQSSCTLWHDYRVGHITSSMFGRVAKHTEKKYPTSLMKGLM